jgi:hypothetical protein
VNQFPFAKENLKLPGSGLISNTRFFPEFDVQYLTAASSNFLFYFFMHYGLLFTVNTVNFEIFLSALVFCYIQPLLIGLIFVFRMVGNEEGR